MWHKRIFITGCAVSGTTLVQRMFYAFDDVKVIDGEITLDAFISKKTNAVLVGKRKPATILSRIIDPKKATKQYNRIKEDNELKIINVIRDGRDVIESRKVELPRWISCIDQFYEYNDIIDYSIRYEDFVENPNEIQKEIEFKFGLKSLHKFSDYPKFVPSKSFSYVKKENRKRYGPRKISKDRIKKNPNLYKKIGNPMDVRIFENRLKKLGYL